MEKDSKSILLTKHEKITLKSWITILSAFLIAIACGLWLNKIKNPETIISIDWRDFFDLAITYPILESFAVFAWPLLIMSFIIPGLSGNKDRLYSQNGNIVMASLALIGFTVLFHQLSNNLTQPIMLLLFAFFTSAALLLTALLKEQTKLLLVFWIYLVITMILFCSLHYHIIIDSPSSLIGYIVFSLSTAAIIVTGRSIVLVIIFHSFINTLYFILRNFQI